MMDNAGVKGNPCSASSSPKHRARPADCFSHCFRGDDGMEPDAAAAAFPSSLVQPPSSWPQSRVVHCRPEPKGRHPRCPVIRVATKRRRTPALGFGYDPLSYSLNFDDGPEFDGDGETPQAEFRYRSFSSRLPSSPPPRPPASDTDELPPCNFHGAWD